MRQLTITRTKCFVACLAKMNVYIEDPAGELEIGGVRCHKLGVLKNGATVTFAISEAPARVFVIADKISRNYCNDFYELPYGETDIYLTGKNEFNPANGNAFRFDNNMSPAAAENRARGTAKGVTVLVVSLIIGFCAGLLLAVYLLN